jgi:F-type H+-transporting ATPase subunit b
MITDSLLFWINLVIVILLLIKFAVKPLMDSLKGRNKEKSEVLSNLESEKEKISGEIEDAMKMLDEKKALLAYTEDNIIKQGKEIKAGIIKEAEIESAQILDKASSEADQEIKAAAEKLRAEVINEMLNNPQTAKEN